MEKDISWAIITQDNNQIYFVVKVIDELQVSDNWHRHFFLKYLNTKFEADIEKHSDKWGDLRNAKLTPVLDDLKNKGVDLNKVLELLGSVDVQLVYAQKIEHYKELAERDM